MTLNEKLGNFAPVIARAARSVAHQWPGVVDKDDVEQSIWIRLLESPGSVEEISQMDSRAQYRAIVGMGHQIASRERTDYDFYKGSYRYSVKEVRDLLNQGILIDPLPSFRAELIDIEEGLSKLNPRYQGAVVGRYRDGEDPASEADQKATERGVDSLVDEMNKAHRTRFSERDDGPGTREVLTREQALDLSGSDWDGEDEF